MAEEAAHPDAAPLDPRRPAVARLIYKLRADAAFASVVHLAARQHLEDNGSDELDAIVRQLRRLASRLEKRAGQADWLTVAGEGRA